MNTATHPATGGHEHASSGRSFRCRFCAAPLRTTFVDLGMSPLCQTHITPEQLHEMEPFYPLHAYVCDECFLVQLQEFVSAQSIFSEYAYFSSYSTSWVEHARRYAMMAIERFGLGPQSKVMEIASNDGYLLQHFVAAKVPVLGIEPAANVAKVAVEKGVPTTVRFFGRESATEIAREHGRPALLLGNNVLAHVPDLNDFVAGMKILLAPGGVITMEFPHLQRLMAENQFDTIYHEHFSYFSFVAVEKVFAHHGLTMFDVEELPTHGGSLRIFARHAEAPARDRRRLPDARALPRFRRPGQADQAQAAGLPDRRQAARQEGGGLRRAGQGQHPAELLRHPHRLPRLHGRRQPVQAGQVHTRNADPHPRTG